MTPLRYIDPAGEAVAVAPSDTPGLDESRPERAPLSRELTDFLVEFSVALHKHAMYPGGHPTLEPAATSVVRRAARMLEERELVAFGVARHQLVIEGVATDPNHPVLGRLAEELHRHHLGAVSVLRGIQPTEVSAALRALATEPDIDGPLGLLPADRVPSWPHLRLHPLKFEGLALVGDADMVGESGGDGSAREAELWIGLARAAMAGETADTATESVPTEPGEVARAIDQHHGPEAYDQVVVGYMLQIARQLKDTPSGQAVSLRRRTAKLIKELKPETLRRLIEMGGDAAQRRSFVFNASHGMAVDSVMKIVTAAAKAGGQTISHGLVRILSKLAAHAETGSSATKPLADAALREQVGSLLTGWELADPNPEAYGKLLQHVASRDPGDKPQGSGNGLAVTPDPLRMVQVCLESGATGPLLDRAIDSGVHQGSIGAFLAVLQTAPPGAHETVSAILLRLAQPTAIGALLAREPIDFDGLDRLAPHMPIESYERLLDILATAEVRATRRKLMDRLSSATMDIEPLIIARLDDAPWFVLRNMLALLERRNRVPFGFSAVPWTSHADVRVRHAAIRLQLTIPDERDIAIRAALDDGEPRLVSSGLAALGGECPHGMARAVVRIAENPATDDDVRLLAVRTLRASREPAALEALLRLVDGGSTALLRRQKLAPPTPAMLAALEALAGVWSTEPRAMGMLAVAARSNHSDVRKAGDLRA